MPKKNKDNSTCTIRKTSIGGQALIEGIMMRGPKKISMTVRNPEGKMVIEEWPVDASKKPKIYRVPFLRGIFGFFDSMKYGYRCLMRSAEISGLDDPDVSEKKKQTVNNENAEKTVNSSAPATEVSTDKTENNITDDNVKQEVAPEVFECDTKKEDKNTSKNKNGSKDSSLPSWVMSTIMVISTVLGVVLALVLFKALPEMLYGLLLKIIPSLQGKTGYGYSLLRAVFVGIIKIAILVGYMLLVSLMKDIKRTFMYHGAEHKSITCYEKGLDLTVENVRKQIRFHPRCGTSFLILMVLVGVFITMFIPAQLNDNEVINVLLRTLISLALLPIMMSVGYELIKIAGKYDNWVTKIISAPGLWLQRVTTREPDDSMIECAIVALKNVIPDDGSDTWDNK